MRTRLAVPLRLDEATANHLYRIAQEAISNAQRHSRATSITVRIACDESGLRLSIHDNGRGLPDDRQNTEGLGLRTMRYRSHMIGGTCDVVNHRSGGVVVRVSCPHSAVQGRSSDSRPAAAR
jgi:signal transduction histidine kinase